jgi:Rad3-related DNA helicase
MLDPDLRRSHQMDFSNSIIIFDEAHNIDQNCQEILSFELSSDTFDNALSYLELFHSYLNLKFNHENNFDTHSQASKVKHLINFLRMWRDNIINYNVNERQVIYQGKLN